MRKPFLRVGHLTTPAMLRTAVTVALVVLCLLLVGFRLPEQNDLSWLDGKWSGTEVYKDDDNGPEQKYSLALDGSEQLGRYRQLDFDFTADDPDLKDKFRLMLFWDKTAGNYRLWYFETDPEDDDPIYELDNKFLVVGKESLQWGDEEQRLKLVKQGDEILFTIEDVNDDGGWDPNSTIHLATAK